jgi:hypothetical protein
MRNDDRPQFLKVMNGISAIKKSPLTVEALDMWWMCMVEWTIEDFQMAAVEVLKRTDYMPSPKDFADLRRAARPTAGEAWDRALGWAASGGYRDGQSGDALTDHCVRLMGGYRVIAMCDESKLHFMERKFCEHYESRQDADDIREALPHLTGSGVQRLLK